LTSALFGFPFCHIKEYCPGDGMKKFVLASALVFAVSPALAGGLTEPAMDPAVVAANTASSGGDTWVGIMMLVLVFGTAIAD
jgi:hypothetical protein